MSPKLGTVMGKLSLVNGIRQEQVTNVAAVKPARAIFQRRKKESLYLILEVTGDPPGRERIYDEMIRIIGEEYFQARGSVTAKLRQAIGAANSFLLQENLKSLPHEQRAGGVTCAVLREGNVYVAQAGPTTAHVSYQGKLTSFPESPLAELTAEEATPLGFKRGLPIRFYRSKVGVGDVILLTSGFLAQQASPEQIAQAVVGQDVDLALANLEELAGEGAASAMLVRVAPVEEKPRVRREAIVRRPVRPRVEAAAKERLPRPDRVSLERGVSSALKGAGDFLRRLLPEQEAPAPDERVTRPRQPYRPAKGRRNLWMGIAIAIPVIVVILVIVVYWQQTLARQAHFDELVAQAQQQIALIGQVDEATARGHLLEALTSLTEAEMLWPGKPEVNRLREEAEKKKDEIDRVTKLYWINPLWEYSEPGSDPGRVIVSRIDVYVLDKALDRVYKHLLDDTMQALQELDVEPVLLRKGDQRGPIVVGELVDMVWAEAKGGRLGSNLLVLEGAGSLLEYDPEEGISVLPVGESDQWIQPQIAGSYKGNFYLLDSALNQILRYEPDYGGLPEDYFPASGEVDLAGVVDMAIDGHVYLLYADGRVLKFLGGEPAPFEMTGLYEPLQNPTALFTSEEAEFLYVADAGNDRVVQLTKEGSFLRQFKAGEGEAFDQLKGLFASEQYNRLYFVSGNRLWVTNLPSE
ncbi:MAG: hypothetical protein FJ014_04190 [Chloroflexi bacterium]|nr:hypothetical protein [Chloroflexota bacterium]